MNVLNRKFQFGAILLVAVMCAASFAIVFADESNAETDEFEQVSYVKDIKLTEENLALMNPYYLGMDKNDIIESVKEFIDALFENLYSSDYTITDIEFSGNGKFSVGDNKVFDGKKSVMDSFVFVEDENIKFKLTVNNTKNVFEDSNRWLNDDKYDLIKAIGFDSKLTAGDNYAGTLDFKYYEYDAWDQEVEKVTDGKYFVNKSIERSGFSTEGKFTLDGIFGKGMTVDFQIGEYEGESITNIFDGNVADMKIGDRISTETRSDVPVDVKKFTVSFDGAKYRFEESDFRYLNVSEIENIVEKGYYNIMDQYDLDQLIGCPEAETDTSINCPYSEAFAQLAIDTCGVTVKTDASGFKKLTDDASDKVEYSEEDNKDDNLLLYTGAAVVIIVVLAAAFFIYKKKI